MTTKTTAEIKIVPTSTVNFYDVLSSNDYDHYPLEVTGFGKAVCGCPAGEKHIDCKHRKLALSQLTFYTSQVTWEEVALGLVYKPVEINWMAQWSLVLDRAA